jgi:ABC-2 type transport system permease protein
VASLASTYLQLMLANLRSQAQYRVSFALQFVGAFMLSVIDFLAILVIFEHLVKLGGWTLPEVAFLYGTSYVSFKIADLLAGHVDHLPDYIRSGRFDSFLIRPLGSLFHVLAADVQLRQLGSIAQGLVVLGYALSRLSLDWSPGRVAMLAIMLVAGAVIYASIFVMANTISFWVTDAREAANAFTYGGSELAEYPLHIFGAWIRRIAMFIVPVGFVSYFPAVYILGKDDRIGVPFAVRFMSPLAAAAAAIVAGRLWKIGVRRYRSTGS